jgi:hypothetical protein
MAGVCLLHSVDRQRAYGIDTEEIEVLLLFRLAHIGSRDEGQIFLRDCLDAPPCRAGEGIFRKEITHFTGVSGLGFAV